MAFSSDDPFADRLREAILDAADLDMSLLSGAVRDTARRALPGHGLAFVRLAHGRARPGDRTQVRRALGDEALEAIPSPADHLEAVLAVCCLIESFGRSWAKSSLIAALATRCAAFQGWAPAHPDLLSYANHYLDKRAVSVRTDSLEQALAVPATKLADKTSDAEGSPPPSSRPALEAIDGLRAAARELANHALITREANEIAWWLASSAPPVGPAVAAMELASITQLLPGPFACDEFLAARMTGAGDAVQVPPTSRLTVEVPEAIAEFCSMLPVPADVERDSQTVVEAIVLSRGIYDQLQLVRAYANSQR